MSKAAIMTVDEVADLLRVDPKVVVALLESGEMAGFQIAAGWRIPFVAVTDFLRCGMKAAQQQALERKLNDPKAWAREALRNPAFCADVEAKDFPEGTMGAFLKEGLRLVRLENDADNVVPIRPEPKN